MAIEETNIVNEIMKDVSPFGARLFRNTRGVFYTIDSVKALIQAVQTLRADAIRSAIRSLRMVAAGLLAPGAPDLIGFKPVIITQKMVGQKIAVLTVIEVKTGTGRPTPEQLHFVNFIKENGGYAGIARSPADAREIMHIPS